MFAVDLAVEFSDLQNLILSDLYVLFVVSAIFVDLKLYSFAKSTSILP